MRVMGVDEEDDYEQGIPDFEEETLIRSKAKTLDFETELRRKALVKILNQVGATIEPQPSHRAPLDETITACITKFNEQDLRYRRAFSLSNVSEGSWLAEGDEDPKECTRVEESSEHEPRRRYSYPLSPRTLAVVPDR